MAEKLDMAGLKAEINRIKDEAHQQLAAKLGAKTKAIHEAIASAIARKKQADSEIIQLESALAELNPGSHSTGKKRRGRPPGRPNGPAKAKPKKGKRIRRGPEDLKKSANEMVAHIKSKGEAAKSELAAFGDPTADVVAFVKKWAQVKIEKVGDFGKNVRYRIV